MHEHIDTFGLKDPIVCSSWREMDRESNQFLYLWYFPIAWSMNDRITFPVCFCNLCEIVGAFPTCKLGHWDKAWFSRIVDRPKWIMRSSILHSCQFIRVSGLMKTTQEYSQCIFTPVRYLTVTDMVRMIFVGDLSSKTILIVPRLRLVQ